MRFAHEWRRLRCVSRRQSLRRQQSARAPRFKKNRIGHPSAQGTKGGGGYDRENYKWRHLVENFFCKIKAFRRIATRYEKTGACFAALIYAVNIVIATMIVNRP